MLREALENLGRSCLAKKHAHIGTQDEAEHLMAMSCHLFEDMVATYLPPGDADHSPSAEKHIRLMLTIEGLEGPNTQDKAERCMAWTGHLDLHQSSVRYCWRRGWQNSPTPVRLQTALEELW